MVELADTSMDEESRPEIGTTHRSRAGSNPVHSIRLATRVRIPHVKTESTLLLILESPAEPQHLRSSRGLGCRPFYVSPAIGEVAGTKKTR